MKASHFVLTLLAATVVSGRAAVIDSTSLTTGTVVGDRLIASSAGIPLASGYAGTGIFSLTDSEIAALAASGNVTALFSAFNPIGGTDDFVTGLSSFGGAEPIPGVYYSHEDNVVITPAEVGLSLYTLFFNGASASTATEFALFNSGLQLALDPGPPFGPTFYGVSYYGAVVLAGNDDGPIVTVTGVFPDPTGFKTLELVPVPEASSMAVASAGLLVAGLRRRR